MIGILPLSVRLEKTIRSRGIQNKYKKQCDLFSSNPKHPSLNVERLEPKSAGIYSFRIDKKYRALFYFISDQNAIEVLDITSHYQ